MNREEWNHVLESEPATPNQVGAIHGEFRRLGIGDRDKRLAITAELLGLGELDSTTDLVMGEAGRLIGILRQTRDRSELPLAADDEDQDERVAGFSRWIAELARYLHTYWRTGSP